MKRTDDNTKWIEECPPEKVLEMMGTYPTTTNQIRVKLGWHVNTVKQKLEKLYSAGKVKRVRAGNIWIWQKIEPVLNNPIIEVEG